MKLAIVTSHPIQYNAPFFALLAQRKKTEIKVFYTWGKKVLEEKFDPGFARSIEWDIPLLNGYEYTFVENTAADPGSHHFSGINNPSLIREIESYGANAVLIFGWSFKSHLAAMRHFKGKIPVLFRGDSTLLDPFGFFKHIIRRTFLTLVYRYIDVALYVGKANFAYFRAHGVAENKLAYAPHAVDNERFFPTDEYLQQAERMRQELKLPSDALVYLFAAKLEPKKDPLQLIRAFKTVNHPRCHLVMVGNGPLEADLHREAEGFTNIHFLPFQNQSVMPAVYHLGDVFVLPSLGPETWGLAINEAMAAGKAVLVSDTCGCAHDLVVENENGFIFRSGDLEDLKIKLQWCADHEGRLKEMGERSQEIVKKFNFLAICESIENVMKNIRTGNVA